MMPVAPIYALDTHVELIAEIVFGVAAIGSAVYCLWRAKTSNSLIPVYLLIGAVLCTLYEPYADVLGLAIYPELDVHVLFTFLGRKIPVYVGFIYLFYFAVAFVYLREQFIKATAANATPRFVPLLLGLLVSLNYCPYILVFGIITVLMSVKYMGSRLSGVFLMGKALWRLPLSCTL